MKLPGKRKKINSVTEGVNHSIDNRGKYARHLKISGVLVEP